MTFGSQRNSGALRPGVIILLGVVAIVLILVAILLLPPPNIRSVAERLIPPGTSITSELNYGDLIGMSGTTEASLIDVAEFYRERLRLGRGSIVGSGISSWSEGRLFGGLRSGVTMPYTREGFVILVRDEKALLAVVASRATNETATLIEIFCERVPKFKGYGTSSGVNRANRFTPPDASSASSASSYFAHCAIFTSDTQLTNVVTYYSTNVLSIPPVASTNWAVSPAGSGMVSIPKRTGADSATFLARPGTNETVLIHCFRSPNSTRTHVLVGSAMK